ncbi:bifunctional diguanylate cyclase/phosphodiesterase [Siccibacter turicensis]|uniref:bifunctional diguanylate cyclase/phosphodiesterase n=1 Tax=Siccibacter turicensis TaxID=357233 RepID=UPI00102139FE|nr:EAL domain-containing protein [Siccibacter turicensis]
MHLVNWYKLHKDNWWCLPLVLPLVLLPLVRMGNTYTAVDGSVAVLYYLPIALFIALMLFFGWAALPGIILTLLIHYFHSIGPKETFIAIIHFLTTIIISWGGYRIFVPHRFATLYGNQRVGVQRLFWLVLCSASVFLMLFQMASFAGFYDYRTSMATQDPLSIRTLINYQGLLVGGLTGIPLCYFIIRVIRHPRYLRSFFSQMRKQFDKRVSLFEVLLWCSVVASLIALLLIPMSSRSIFNSNYTLSLLLPVMLWGAMRFGVIFTTAVWTPVIILLTHYFSRYISDYQGFDVQLAIASSSFAVFSCIIIFMAMVSTRQRELHTRARRVAYIDPIIQLPNLRALNQDLSRTPWSVLFLMRMPELDLLGRNYGVMLGIHYKQQLATWVRDVLYPDELVYQLSGDDMVLRLNTEFHKERIEALDKRIKAFRFVWDGMPLQPQVGMSYCYVRTPVSHLPLLLGEMSTMADLSLATLLPESLQRTGVNHVQRAVKMKVEMMNRLQQALDNDEFRLVAQRIEGARGDHYYEILLRMLDDNGELITPDKFLPVAHEFGFSSRIDSMVLEKTLRFMHDHRQTLPASRFSINLTPASVCRAMFPGEVRQMLERYQVEPWQIIFEVTESNSLSNVEQANLTLSRLQSMGCRVAIDDFGTGYASYARLKNVNADILKIDGSFIRNLLSSSLDYQIVASICHLARMKKMQVVAEYVETEAIRDEVRKLGIDYLQGFLIGYPIPLETLLALEIAEGRAVENAVLLPRD